MRKLSDYKGEEAIDLWADLLTPIVKITGDPKVAKVFRAKKPVIEKAKTILKTHKSEAAEILTRIDPTPLDGINIVIRLVDMLVEIESQEELKGFFSPSPESQTSFGSVMENIEASEN